ncbi:unnamed protein product [Mytilus coruscus]|uniref:Integrase catalytic domain-containing protein n=1 Tax=Mytilus coruscus TaxID=42192 RepID=A0A6J8CSV2_MYTCO|nr:unnamed protein product [Mytilus coruscus]
MEQTFQVFENFKNSIILGLDFLDQQKARLNFDDKTLVLQSGITEVPLTNGENNDNSTCFTSLINDEVIPSRSEVIILVQTVDKSIKSKIGIIEPNPALVGKQNIVGATCLVQIRNNKSFLQVLNPTNVKVRLSKHTKIGKFSEIIENSISSEITENTIEINAIDKGAQNKNNEAKYIEIAKILNFDFSNSDLTPEEKQKLMIMLGTNTDVFAINLSELGCTDLHPHRTDTGDATPVRQRFYRQSPAMKTESSKHIKEMLDNNMIEPSQSEWASPVCLMTYYFIYTTRKEKVTERIVKRLAVPLTLRDDNLKSYYDSVFGGHNGIERTNHTIRYKYYWPGMYNYIQQCVQTCIQCQRAKPDAHKRPTPLQPLPVLDVFRRVHMDILGRLIVDSFTKFMEILPLKNTGAKDVADLFNNQWICRYSAPDAILTDKGQNFMSNILKEVCNIFEIQKINTSSYRPQTNSTCERNNKTLAEKLRTCIDANQLNWPEKLPSIAHAMNTSVCTESTQYTPYFLVFGKNAELLLTQF